MTRSGPMPVMPWAIPWSVPTARPCAPRSITAGKIFFISCFPFLSPNSINVPPAILSQSRADYIFSYRDIHRGGQNDRIGHFGGGPGGGLLETGAGRGPACIGQPSSGHAGRHRSVADPPQQL